MHAFVRLPDGSATSRIVVAADSWDMEVTDPMTPNMPAALYNTLVTAFFVVIVIAAALGAYAAVSLKKLEKKSQHE
jgi:hypothetical protein